MGKRHSRVQPGARTGRVRKGRTPNLACCTALAIAVLLAASCAFPGSVRPTVKIGLVAPFEGRYRYVGYDVIYAVRLALREVNAKGGVAGYDVELVAYDDRGDPALAMEQARKLDIDPEVLGALGHFREPSTMAALGIYAKVGLPLVAPTELAPWVRERAGIRAAGPTADQLAVALIDRTVRIAHGETTLLVDDGGPLGGALREAAQVRDAKLVVVSPDGDGWWREALRHDPAVLLCDLDPVRAGEVVSALRERAWAGDVLGGPTLGLADFVGVAGASATGATFATPWPFPNDVPGGDDFAEAYQEVSGGPTPGPLALPAYEGAWMLLKALERAAAEGAPTRQRVLAALSDLEGEDPLSPLAARNGASLLDAALYWYRIGSDGVPRLMEVSSSTALESALASYEAPPN